MGKEMLNKVGIDIATYLQLPNPEVYTGHCWRRSAATAFANAGASAEQLKRKFRWKTEATAGEYIDTSALVQLQDASALLGHPPMNSNVFQQQKTIADQVDRMFSFTNCQTVNLTFNIGNPLTTNNAYALPSSNPIAPTTNPTGFLPLPDPTSFMQLTNPTAFPALMPPTTSFLTNNIL